MASSTGDSGGSPGPSTDRNNEPVIDPSKNVLDLVEAAIQRQDDLRSSESVHLREIMALRSEFTKELRLAEADRINAIRAVDVAAVQHAAEVQSAQAQILATQVATQAEALRSQVAATAQQQTLALSAALDPIQKDVADLRRVQYEQQGQKTNQTENRSDRQVNIGNLFAGVGVLVAVLVALAAFLGYAAK
jgi:hypothetical protein